MALISIFTFSVLALMTASYDVSAALVPRPPSPNCVASSWACPPTDNAFYPLSSYFSGILTDPTDGLTYLTCFYPFLSNCEYNPTSGTLLQDNDDGYCPANAEKSGCSGAGCQQFNCPSVDRANYTIGTGSGLENSTILFCTYPTTIQPYIGIYFCNYGVSDGSLWEHADISDTTNFCPAEAVSSQTCLPTGAVSATTASPTSQPTKNSPAASQSTSKPSSSTLHAADLILENAGAAIVLVTGWLTFPFV